MSCDKTMKDAGSLMRAVFQNGQLFQLQHLIKYCFKWWLF